MVTLRLPLMNIFIEEGIDCVNLLGLAVGMGIGEVKQEYGDKIALWGNIGYSHLLPFGSVDKVKKARIECIMKVGRNEGYILFSSNTIHSAIPAENFVTMVETARKYGKYLLNLV